MRPCKRCGGEISVSGDGDETYVASCSGCLVAFARGDTPGFVREVWNRVHEVGATDTYAKVRADQAEKLEKEARAATESEDFRPETKRVRREHKIDGRHCLVFEAKKICGLWWSKCTLMKEGYPCDSAFLMGSNWQSSVTADDVANAEQAWVEFFRRMGNG